MTRIDLVNRGSGGVGRGGWRRETVGNGFGGPAGAGTPLKRCVNERVRN